MAWNYADVYEAVADKTPPGTPALIHAGPGGTEGRVVDWAEYMERTNRLARAFLGAGLEATMESMSLANACNLTRMGWPNASQPALV